MRTISQTVCRFWPTLQLLLCFLCCNTAASWSSHQLESVLLALKDRELACLDAAVTERFQLHKRTIASVNGSGPEELPHCPSAFDGFICWPRLPGGSSLSLPCPAGIFLGGVGRAHRTCRPDGIWDFPSQVDRIAAGYEPTSLGGNLSTTAAAAAAAAAEGTVLTRAYTNYSECSPGSLHSELARRMRITHIPENSQLLRVGLERLLCHKLGLKSASGPLAAGAAAAGRVECPSVFDNALCWPKVPAGATVYMSCPEYINQLDRQKLAWRTCLPNGTWLWPESVPLVRRAGHSRREGWTNFSDCSVHGMEDDGQIQLRVINVIHTMGHVGYGLSLTFLLLAIFTLCVFRRLHCRRNAIHINMFIALCLRAFSHFVIYFLLRNEQIILCRINQSLMTYSVLASFTWVFVEALHLYVLIFVNTLSSARLTTLNYMAIGWGTPCLISCIWVILRVRWDNTECWRTYKPMGADIWLVNLYLCVLVFINAGLFIRIVRELFVKMKSQPRSTVASQKYRKLWRSTSVLVIVFGIYYIIFLPMSIMPKDRLGATLDSVKLFYEHFFNSFQGFCVSLLFCFVNSEVHMEIKRLLLETRAGQWLKAHGMLRPPEDVYGLDPENRRNSRRRARRAADKTECLPLHQPEQPEKNVNGAAFLADRTESAT